MSKLFNDSERTDFDEIIKSELLVCEKRRRLESLIHQAQERICNEQRENDKLYYNIIRNYKNNHNNDRKLGIITTNYTKFAETITEIGENNIAYVHGKLDLFENKKSKLTGSMTSFSEDDFIFPFIFVQSGIKPIVSSQQIHQFEKAVQMIENADELLILGYGINSDDEHLSNLLRERIMKGKKITCFLYDDSKENRRKVEEELQSCDGKVIFKGTEEFNDVLQSL